MEGKGNKCWATVVGGILHMEDGKEVSLLQMQADLNEMFGMVGDNRLAEMANELSVITGLVQGPHGEWEERKPRYNHMYSIAFSLENSSPDGEGTTTEELLEAMKRRVMYLQNNPNEVHKACGLPHDTYEVEE